MPGAVLVELLTSERCADCPPADALLRQIEGKQTESGELIVVISEHGTYWNQLGWSDPFSSGSYTERETAYGQRFHLDGVAQMDLTALKIPQSLLRQLFKFDADYAEALFALDQRPRSFKLQAILRHASAALERMPQLLARFHTILPPRARAKIPALKEAVCKNLNPREAYSMVPRREPQNG